MGPPKIETTPSWDERRRSRVDRFLRPQEGGGDIFGSEKSYSLPVGTNFDLEAKQPGGYYIDFRLKLSKASWPPSWMLERDEQYHVATVQWALGAYEHYLRGDGEQWLAAAKDAAEYLLSIQEVGGASDGGWLHWMPMRHTFAMPLPWLSAIGQGEAASLFVRLHGETGDERYEEAGLRALEPLHKSTAVGGLQADLDGHPFLEEYPTAPPSLVLNGAIFGIWGARDAAHYFGDSRAASLFDEVFEGLAATLHRFDTGRWSKYDLFPHPIVNLATPMYHLLHVHQLTVLDQMRPNPEIRRIRDNFDRYRELRRNRAAALSRKVAFRLLVPRQRALALRNPSMARQRRRRAQPESIALCYHAVSEDWPAALSVRPDSLRRQLSLLLDRGYEPVTFSELVLGDADGARRMAVTFDDGYASVHDRALPILEQLGIPGTLFIPTAFVPGTELLGWEGIGQWAQTEHAEELRPLSAEQLRAIAAAGWEIGSHSRTHPRLTQLNDEQLAAELRGSREDTERVLSAPCLSIAYPYGDVDERVERAAAEAGYACAAALPAGRLVGSRNAWPRVGIYNADDDRRFKLKVARPMLALRRSRAWNLRA